MRVIVKAEPLRRFEALPIYWRMRREVVLRGVLHHQDDRVLANATFGGSAMRTQNFVSLHVRITEKAIGCKRVGPAFRGRVDARARRRRQGLGNPNAPLVQPPISQINPPKPRRDPIAHRFAPSAKMTAPHSSSLPAQMLCRPRTENNLLSARCV